MNNKSKWIDQCKVLPVGSKKRVRCCGNDISRILENKADRYVSTCFRSTCKNYVEMKTGIARLTAEACKGMREELRKHTVPQDTMYHPLEFPPSAIAWLSKAGLHQDIWLRYEFGYSPKYNRVVVPIWMEGKKVGATLRALNPDDVKYLMHTDVRGALFTCHSNSAHNHTVVVTEDILSALRVEEAINHSVRLSVGVGAVSILGTGVMQERALYLVNKYKRVIFWLDGDQAGITATEKWVRKLEPYVKVEVINCKDADPKDFASSEIRDKIRDKMIG